MNDPRRKKVLLQIRHGYRGLMVTCNEYLKAFPGDDYLRIVVFLTGTHCEAIAQAVPADKVIFLGLRSTQLRGLKISVVRKLLRICRDHGVDMILAHRYKAAFVTGLLTLFHGTALRIIVVHGLGQFHSWSRRTLFRLLFRDRFLMVGISEAVAADIRNVGPGLDSARVLALPNCLDIERTRAEQLGRTQARALLNVDDEDFVFGHVGRLSPSKDQHTMISAFGLAAADMPEAKLLIVGGGRLEQSLKAHAKALGLDERVQFTGKIDRAARLMPGFDVFVLTSKKEGFGRVLLEAMAARLPLLVTAAGGIPEVVDGLTELCGPGDVEAIARRYRYFYRLDQDAYQQACEQSQRRLMERFSDGQFSNRLMHFINHHRTQ